MKILHVVGARPNFMKAAPVMAALSKCNGFSQVLVHTGQHYDANMSDVFFRQLGLPKPDINLEVGAGSHAVQTAQIMTKMEQELLTHQPRLVLVYGDVNSTVAAALVCAKLRIPFGHVEAGLRSFDREMPEEINRLVTDQLADLLFTPSADGDENLSREGIRGEKIHMIGNVMIDTLVRLTEKAEEQHPLPQIVERYRLSPHLHHRNYALVTLHRPSNVDDPQMLLNIMAALHDISKAITIVFPIHPRTRQRLQELGINRENPKIYLTEPLGYLEFLTLQKNARIVITDSGGIQEETTFIGIPCLTVRANTERPVTVNEGSNILVGQDMQRLKTEVYNVMAGKGKKGFIPHLWDGKAGERLADILTAMKDKTAAESPALSPFAMPEALRGYHASMPYPSISGIHYETIGQTIPNGLAPLGNPAYTFEGNFAPLNTKKIQPLAD